MKNYLLAVIGCCLLFSCKKDQFGDNPATDIIGTWYYIGWVNQDGAYEPATRVKAYTFNDDGTYNYWRVSSPPYTNVYEVKGDKLYRNGDLINYNKLKFTETQMHIANQEGADPQTWDVYEQ